MSDRFPVAADSELAQAEELLEGGGLRLRLASPAHRRRFVAAFVEYQRDSYLFHRQLKRSPPRDYQWHCRANGIPPWLIMIAAQIVWKILVYWWENRRKDA